MEGYIGEIRLFGPIWSPGNWALCQGQLLTISQYGPLFSIIGTLYGGDGRTTFALPDLRGRAAVHAGSGPGLSSYKPGEKRGAFDVTLSQGQLPIHSHATTASSTAQLEIEVNSGTPGDSEEPATRYQAEDGSLGGDLYADTHDGSTLNANAITGNVATSVTIASSGGSQSHYNMQPFQAVSYIICLVGIYPSRN